MNQPSQHLSSPTGQHATEASHSVDDKFLDIRPYKDEEIRPVLDELMSDDEFINSIANFYFPRLSKVLPALPRLLARKKLAAQLAGVHDVASMQDVIAQYMDKMIEDTTTSLSHSGMERLQAGKSYLFICNHRDIVMDPAFVNYMLYHAGHPTLQIAIGDNLLKKPFVSDLMRLNKSFIVQRSLKGRELLKSLTLLSEYIAHAVSSGQNVWIAQKEGRAKDGLDVTDPTLLKMLAMSERKTPIGETLKKLHIVPVAISYEFDACDALKADELYRKRRPEGFEKTERSDIDSIVTGMIGFKGKVHVAFGEELQGIESLEPEQIAELIDEQIVGNYRLTDSNYIALDQLIALDEVAEADLGEYNPGSVAWEEASAQAFNDRLKALPAYLRKTFLRGYANPVLNRLGRGQK